MNIEDAIKRGYEFYLYADGDYQHVKDISDLLNPVNADEWDKKLELCEKEPYHPAGIDAKGLLELLADDIEDNHRSESGDDTNNVSDAINAIDHSIVEPLVQAIYEALHKLNYYKASGIPLTRNVTAIGLVEPELCNRETEGGKCVGNIIEEDTAESCSCATGNPPCSYCTTDRNFCPECGWSGKDEQ